MVNLDITLEEENIETILRELSGPQDVNTKQSEDGDKKEDMDTHEDILLKYECEICKKRIMTKKGLKLHKARMHEKSLQRLEREKSQIYSCDECDIKRSTEVLLKSHMKHVHGNIKRNLSEMRRGPKVTRSPPSLSPPSKKPKEDNSELEEEELEKRIENIRRPRPKKKEPELQADNKKEIDNLKRLLSASGEVIATLEDENNHLNTKAEFYEEVAEGLVIENESLLLRLQQKEEQETHKNVLPPVKNVTFNLDPEQNIYEREEGEDTGTEGETVEEKKNEESVAEVQTGYRQQSGRATCIVCGITRNTKSQMVKHMEQHKEDGEFVPAGQKHCGLTAFPDCPFQCYSNEELMKHIETDHKKT